MAAQPQPNIHQDGSQETEDFNNCNLDELQLLPKDSEYKVFTLRNPKTKISSEKFDEENECKRLKLTSTMNNSNNNFCSTEVRIHPDIQLQNKYSPLSNTLEKETTSNTPIGKSNNSKEDETSNFSQPKKPRMPPIVVKKLPNGNIFEQNKKLQSLLNESMKISYSQEGIKYHTATRSDYDKLYSILQNENIPFYSHEPRDSKLLQVVFKGLPVNVEPSILKEELIHLSYAIEHVRQLSVSEQSLNGTLIRKPISVWVVSLPNNEHSRTIYHLKDINHHTVKVESYKPTPHIIQCHKCQGFGHTSKRCNLQTRCVKCGDEHLFANCPSKGPDYTPKCANCNGSHTASYGQCPVQQQQRTALLNKLRNRQEARSQPQNSIPLWSSPDFPSLPKARNTDNFSNTYSKHTVNSTEGSLSDSIKDIITLVKNLNISNIIKTIQSTLIRITTATDTISKLMIIFEGITEIIQPQNGP